MTVNTCKGQRSRTELHLWFAGAIIHAKHGYFNTFPDPWALVHETGGLGADKSEEIVFVENTTISMVAMRRE